VTYANEMKTRLLNVPEEILDTHGAVSEECARFMAEGVRELSGSSMSVAITGIAGPEGGTPDKPVGTICFAVSDQHGTSTLRRVFPFRDRTFVRSVAAYAALALVRRRLLDGQRQ
jgi:nicotinamide-nucleotide amidase